MCQSPQTTYPNCRVVKPCVHTQGLVLHDQHLTTASNPPHSLTHSKRATHSSATRITITVRLVFVLHINFQQLSAKRKNGLPSSRYWLPPPLASCSTCSWWLYLTHQRLPVSPPPLLPHPPGLQQGDSLPPTVFTMYWATADYLRGLHLPHPLGLASSRWDYTAICFTDDTYCNVSSVFRCLG